MHATTIPARFAVRAYNYRSAPDPIESTDTIHDDRTTYGEAYTWGTPHLTVEEAKREALLRREAALAGQVAYHGTCNMLDLTPASVLKFSNRELPDAKYGLLAVRVKCSASRSKPYRVEFTAIPSDRLYRLPLLEHTWPRIHGTITGRIASPGDYPEPYVDERGEYIVNLHLDRDSRTPGLNSCPMRLAKPFAGANESGLHFGLVDGTEVTVAFHHGNPDLPYISQVLHNSRAPDPIVCKRRWNSRSTIHTRSNNTVEFEDWPDEEHIKVATEQGKSQLNLGHTVDRDRKLRGNGFELRTDLKGSLRAGAGLLVSADMQEKALGQQTDMKPAMNQFQLAQAQAQGLADVAAVAKAEIADLKAENQWLKDELSDLKKAVIALSAPHGIGLATPDRIMVAAGKDVSLTTSARFNVSAVRNIAIAAGDVLSLFAHRLGIKLFAARGKIQIQAQSDAMELVSQKDLNLCSANGTLVANAANGVVLSGGGSAYIKVQGDDVEIGGAGNLILKIIEVKKSGPGSLSLPLPLPKFEQTNIAPDEKFILSDALTGRPAANRPYKIQLAGGRIVEGVTNASGETSLAKSDIAQGVKLLLSTNNKGA
jgi:type VI secretion system secreted protein VgrG